MKKKILFSFSTWRGWRIDRKEDFLKTTVLRQITFGSCSLLLWEYHLTSVLNMAVKSERDTRHFSFRPRVPTSNWTPDGRKKKHMYSLYWFSNKKVFFSVEANGRQIFICGTAIDIQTVGPNCQLILSNWHVYDSRVLLLGTQTRSTDLLIASWLIGCPREHLQNKWSLVWLGLFCKEDTKVILVSKVLPLKLNLDFVRDKQRKITC